MAMLLRVGYVPLTDALPLFVAEREGFYAQNDLRIELVAMRSWAQMRDALILGQVDAGHCLPGIPLASQAGLFGDQVRLACAMTMNHFGNAITLSQDLYDVLNRQNNFSDALVRACGAQHTGKRKLSFASVYPVSKHEFELRHWLRSFGLNPDLDVNLLVIPPPLVAEALKNGQIDGFCVGEPWSSLAVSQGLGQVVATSRSLDLPGTEKVIAVQQDFIETETHAALIRSLVSACDWLESKHNRQQAREWLAEALKLQADVLQPGLFAINGENQDRHMQFSGINRPDRWHARWLLGQIEMNMPQASLGDAEQASVHAFRSDIYDHIVRT